MTEEWLDIVNMEDCVVGRDTRRRVHETAAIHRATHIVVLNSSNQVFVQQRSHLKDEAPGLWDTSCAGHVDSGETYLQCAVRELQEELGLVVQANELVEIGKQPPTPENGFEFTTIYITCADAQLTLAEEEVADGRWLSPDELDLWMSTDPRAFTEGFKKLWPVVKTYRLSPLAS